ncbi:hypothetical protein [Xenophilus sp. Marseille-Q4582]|uniref:hypothetical protein n=1 Tax=Xenophilus sp. Marseille-Q4582 TaxID=2866600 RepID=UPI001CE44E69|nr:hypothetical protein [Xenophilus sp. Marseille-Q4582]
MKVLSNWRAVRLWETQLERELHRRHHLRLHGFFIGSFMLLVMWGVAALQMHLGVQSLALRYLVTLGVGYLVYLGVLRWWAQRLVQRRRGLDLEVPDLSGGSGSGSGGGASPTSGGSVPLPRTGGGDFAGGGASGDFSGGSAHSVAEAGGEGLGQLASGAFEVAGSADEGAVIVVPVVAVFLVGAAVLFGAGSLVIMYFGFEALLAVAIEVAFSYTAARTAVRVSREGWLSAAVRLTWKPLLGALVCAVVLGLSIDHFLPQANSLPEALKLLRAR